MTWSLSFWLLICGWLILYSGTNIIQTWMTSIGNSVEDYYKSSKNGWHESSNNAHKNLQNMYNFGVFWTCNWANIAIHFTDYFIWSERDFFSIEKTFINLCMNTYWRKKSEIESSPRNKRRHRQAKTSYASLTAEVESVVPRHPQQRKYHLTLRHYCACVTHSELVIEHGWTLIPGLPGLAHRKGTLLWWVISITDTRKSAPNILISPN